MRTLSWLLVLVAGAAVEGADRRTEENLLLAAAITDLVTTEMFLAGGIEEANPLGRNRALRIAGKAGATALAVWGARELEKDGHQRAASILRWVTIGAWFGVSGWNVSATIRAPD